MSSEHDFDAGDAVILHGLRQATHLNGCRAVVHEYQGAPSARFGRFAVRLDDRDASRMRQMMAPMPAVLPRNLALDYAVGTRAMLQDLVRTAHLNGRVVTVTGFCRRQCRFIVEMPADDQEEEKKEEKKKDETKTNDKNEGGDQPQVEEDTAPNASASQEGNHDANSSSRDETLSPDHKKARPNTPKPPRQQVVKPANLTHLPGCRPPRVPVCEQRLIFTGSMASITKVLDHSPHRPNHGPFANVGGGASNRYGLLSESMSGLDTMQGNASIEEVSELMTALDLWHKIKARSYASSKSNGESAGGDGNDTDGNDGDDNTGNSNGTDDALPQFYQKLVKVSDEHTNKICFNPKCRRHILPCTQKKMKRCTNCRAVAYCGRDCASADWSYHRKMCRIIQREDARFADFVTLTSPNRKEALETQRMVRLCANRVASMEDPEGYLDQLPTTSDGATGGASASGSTATLLYRIVTEAGGDIANQVLHHLENPPPPGKEATVAVGFRSLCGPVFGAGDIQKFANTFDCTVTSQVLGTNEDEDIVKDPNGERVSSGAPEGVADWLNNIAGEGTWQFLGAGNGPPPNLPGMPQGGMAMQFAFPPIPVMHPGGGGGGPPAPGGNPDGAGPVPPVPPFPMPMPMPMPMPGGMFGGGPPPPAQQGADPGGNGGANMHNHFQIPGLPPGVEAHVHVVNAGVVQGQQPQAQGAAGGDDAPNEGAAGGDAPNNDAGGNANGGLANDNIPFVPEGLNAFLNGIMNNPGGAAVAGAAVAGAAVAGAAVAGAAVAGAAVAGAADNAVAPGAGGGAPQAEDAPNEDADANGGQANNAEGNGANNIPVMPEGLNALLNGIMNNVGQAGQANEGNEDANNEDEAELAAVEEDEVLDEENGGGGGEGVPNPNANPLAFLPNLLQAVAAAGAENGNGAGENPGGNGPDGNEGGNANGGGMPMPMPMPMPFPEGGFQIPGLPGGVQAQVFAGAIPVPMGAFGGAGGVNVDEEQEEEADEMNIED